MTIGQQIRLAQWAQPLIYPGSSTKRLLILGDSHASYINGALGERYIYGIPRTWPCVFKGFYGGLGSWLTQIASTTAGTSVLNIGPTQHPIDGNIAPQEAYRYAPGAPVGTDVDLISRVIYDPALLANLKQGSTTGNPFLNKAMTNRLVYWRKTTSLSTGRTRTLLSDFATVPTDSVIDYSGATGYSYRDIAFSTSGGFGPGYDMLSGAEDETTKEFTLIGHRFELANPAGGVCIAAIGNGGQTAAAYADASTVCSNARWTDWLATVGPFDRIMFVLGTNMVPGVEDVDITGVWAANMASLTTKIMTLNAAAGATNAMGLVITGHDANITARYAGINTACRAVATANPQLAYYDSWADLPPYATLSATYLNDGVHFNAGGALLVSQTIADAMSQAIRTSGGGRSGRVNRVRRVNRG